MSMNTSSDKNTSRNISVDVFRLLAALSVIILHLKFSELPRDLVIGARLLSRWAVPFFFIVSGYYFASQKKELELQNIQKTVGRLIWLFLIWSVIYIPMIINQHDLKTVFQRFLSPNFIYFGSVVHLWFISSLIMGYIFISFCYQYNMKFFLFISSIGFIILSLISEPYPILTTVFTLESGFASQWLSVPLLSLGFYFYKKGFPTFYPSLLLVITGIALQILESRFIYLQYGISAYEHEFLLGTIPFTIGMCGIAFSNPKWLRWNTLGKWGQEYSLGIYLIHMLVIYISSKLISMLFPNISETMLFQALFPFLVFSLCILFFKVLHRWAPTVFHFLNGTLSTVD